MTADAAFAHALTEIKVSIAELRGEVREGFAELRGTVGEQGRGLTEVRLDVSTLDARLRLVEDRQTLTRGKLIGVGSAAAVVSSGTTVGLLQLLGGLAG